MANIYSELRTMLFTPEIAGMLREALSPNDITHFQSIYNNGSSKPPKHRQKRHLKILTDALMTYRPEVVSNNDD